MMDRRSFLKGAATATGVTVHSWGEAKPGTAALLTEPQDEKIPNVEGYTLVCSFQHDSTDCKAYEDLRTRDGSLVLEDSEADRLYVGRGVPRAWFARGSPVQIESAATRWGDVSFDLHADMARKRVTGNVSLAGKRAPADIEVRFRLPEGNVLQGPTVNGRAARVAADGQTVLVPAGAGTHLRIDSTFS